MYIIKSPQAWIYMATMRDMLQWEMKFFCVTSES